MENLIQWEWNIKKIKKIRWFFMGSWQFLGRNTPFSDVFRWTQGVKQIFRVHLKCPALIWTLFFHFVFLIGCFGFWESIFEAQGIWGVGDEHLWAIATPISWNLQVPSRGHPGIGECPSKIIPTKCCFFRCWKSDLFEALRMHSNT